MSTTPKHTPGPWAWEAADASMVGLGPADDPWGPSTIMWCVRCPACQKQLDEKRFLCGWPNEANSALIAAAPDLLAACEWVLEGVRTMGSDWSDVAEEKLAAAIEKATGGTTGPVEFPQVVGLQDENRWPSTAS